MQQRINFHQRKVWPLPLALELTLSPWNVLPDRRGFFTWGSLGLCRTVCPNTGI